MAYVVTGAMALCDRKDGTTVPVMRGGAVPEDVTDEHLQHLLDVGLVKEAEKGELAGGLEPTRAGDGSEPVVDDEGAKAPAQVATKDEWVAYAVSQGMAQQDAEAATKAQLVEKYKG